MSKSSDEAESDISEASSDIQEDESMEREVSDFGKQARKAHENYMERREKESSGVEKVMEDFGTAEADASDEEIRAVSEELGTLEDEEVQDVAKIGKEVQGEVSIEDDIQSMISNVDEAEEDIGEAVNDIGTDLSKAQELIEKDPNKLGQSAVKQFSTDVKDLENAAKVEDEAEDEMEHIIEDLATLESEDKQLERFEKNLQAQLQKEDGMIDELEEDSEELGDKELLKKARDEDQKLGKLKKKLAQDERITEEAEKRLGKEIEEMRDELMKVEDVEGALQNREEQLEKIAQEAKQQESKADPETQSLLETVSKIASEGATQLSKALDQEKSKLQKEEKQVNQLEKQFRGLSAKTKRGIGKVIVFVVVLASLGILAFTTL